MKNYKLEKYEKCNGKNCYKSREEAEAVAREQEALHIMDDLELKTYRCIECGEWHLSRAESSKL